MKNTVWGSVEKVTKEGSKIYAVDMYCNNIYLIDLSLNRIEIIGEVSGEEEYVYAISDIYIFDNKLVMLPKNGKYIHIFDIDTKRDSIYDLNKDVSGIDEVYDCFSILYENDIYMFNRTNGSIYAYNYFENKTHMIQMNMKHKKLQITNKYLTEDSIFMHCCLSNHIIVFSVPDNKVSSIPLPEELKGILTVYKIEQYIVVYQDSTRYIYFLNEEGKILKKFNTTFKEKQIEPFVFKSGKEIFVLGNREGELCRINIESDSVEMQKINGLSCLDVVYKGEYGDYIIGFQMTKSYEEIINKVIKISKKTFEAVISELEFDASDFLDIINFKYEQSISQLLMQNKIHTETEGINLERFIKGYL